MNNPSPQILTGHSSHLYSAKSQENKPFQESHPSTLGVGTKSSEQWEERKRVNFGRTIANEIAIETDKSQDFMLNQRREITTHSGITRKCNKELQGVSCHAHASKDFMAWKKKPQHKFGPIFYYPWLSIHSSEPSVSYSNKNFEVTSLFRDKNGVHPNFESVLVLPYSAGLDCIWPRWEFEPHQRDHNGQPYEEECHHTEREKKDRKVKICPTQYNRRAGGMKMQQKMGFAFDLWRGQEKRFDSFSAERGPTLLRT